MSCLCNFGCHVVPYVWVEGCHQHQGLVEKLINMLPVHGDAVLRENKFFQSLLLRQIVKILFPQTAVAREGS